MENSFQVKIDHHNLQSFLEQKKLQERQQKWASRIPAYDSDIGYVKERNNEVTDALSHKPTTLSLMTKD